MPRYPFTPELLDALPEELCELFRGLELQLLEEICSRLKIADQLNEVTVQDIRALRAHGIDLEDIKAAIAEATGTGADKLEALLDDGSRPILVAVDGEDWVLGYAFCVRQSRRGDGALQDLETLYLDDLCVDEACRGQHVGQALYEAVVELARSLGCYNVTLNVWSCNREAMAFYERCGLRPQKVGTVVLRLTNPQLEAAVCTRLAGMAERIESIHFRRLDGDMVEITCDVIFATDYNAEHLVRALQDIPELYSVEMRWP